LSRSLKVTFTLATTLIALIVCACGKTERSRARAAAPAPSAPTPAPLAIAPPTAPVSVALPDGARIYVDLSFSMIGFPAGGPANLESVHQQVLSSLAANGQQVVEYCELGKDPAPTCGITATPMRYRNKDLYKGLTSPLATVFETPAPDPAVAQRPRAAVFDKRISVFITDGLESGSPLAAGAPEGGGGAIPGPNVYRLRDAINERSKDGFGTWALTISLPFSGRVIPERGLGKELFKRAQDHLKTVALDPAYQGIRMEARDHKMEPNGEHHYSYLGPRPLLVLVVSQDIALGRAFVDTLKKRLRDEKVSQPADRVESLELAPHDVRSIAFSGLKSTLARGERTHFMRIVERKEGGFFHGRYECRGPAAGRIEFSTYVAREATVKLPGGLKQTIDLQATALPATPGVVTAPTALGGGRFAAEVDCAKVTQETVIDFALTSAVVRTEQATGWWDAWSAPNAYEMPERLFGLADFVQGVVATQVRPPVRQDVARLFISKKG
jgi:hypothetical protein